MKTQHTPGPWAVELPYNEPGVYVTAANPRMSNPLICRLIDQAQAPEGRANSRLIAAAPDLLAALESWIACANDGDRHTPAWIDVFNACAAQSRAAIAKARGEE